MKEDTKQKAKLVMALIAQHASLIRTVLIILLMVMMVTFMSQMEVTEELIYNTYKMNLMVTVLLGLMFIARIGK